MPWKEVSPMEEIIRFVMLAQSARFTVSELCEQFGISRKTGYKQKRGQPIALCDSALDELGAGSVGFGGCHASCAFSIPGRCIT